MTDHHPMLAELGQAADQALHNVRKMAMRRDSRQLIESYLGDCQACFLSATEDARRSDPGETVSDLSRAFRYARPNAELIGTLVVLATVSHHGPHDFRCLSLAVSARMRAELRDHSREGLCDPEDIRLGVEMALQSMEPLAAA